METNFNFKSQICTDREQSERLLALGLKKTTADCRWTGVVKDSRGKDIPKNEQMWFLQLSESENYQTCRFSRTEFLPAWSLHRLLSLLPDYIVVNSSSGLNPNFYLNIRDGFVSYKDNRGFSYGSTSGNMYDAIISMISFLIKEGYFNKEYLEE